MRKILFKEFFHGNSFFDSPVQKFVIPKIIHKEKKQPYASPKKQNNRGQRHITEKRKMRNHIIFHGNTGHAYYRRKKQNRIIPDPHLHIIKMHLNINNFLPDINVHLEKIFFLHIASINFLQL